MKKIQLLNALFALAPEANTDPGFHADALRLTAQVIAGTQVSLRADTRHETPGVLTHTGLATAGELPLGEFSITVHNLRGDLSLTGVTLATSQVTGGVVTTQVSTEPAAIGVLTRLHAALLLGGMYLPSSNVIHGDLAVEGGEFMDDTGESAEYRILTRGGVGTLAVQQGGQYLTLTRGQYTPTGFQLQ